MWEWIDAHHDELQALMPVATIFAALIAILVTGSLGIAQWRIARAQKDIALDKLKLDLFVKRYAVYDAARKIAEYIVTRKTEVAFDYENEIKQIREWTSTIAEAGFYFDAKTHKTCEQLLFLVEEYVQEAARLNVARPENPEREVIQARQKTVVIQVEDMWESLPTLFEKSLKFKQLTRER
jgi:hypothetical protein